MRLYFSSSAIVMVSLLFWLYIYLGKRTLARKDKKRLQLLCNDEFSITQYIHIELNYNNERKYPKLQHKMISNSHDIQFKQALASLFLWEMQTAKSCKIVEKL